MPTYHFGPFAFDADSGELHHDGEAVRLRHQPAALLTALLDRHGAVLTRAEIVTLLWAGNVHVDVEAGINFVVRQLRVALGDDASAPAYLETLPRRGYRLLVPVRRVPGDRPAPAVLATPASEVRYGAMVGLLAASATWLLLVGAQPPSLPLRLLVQFGTDASGARHFDRDGFRDLVIANLAAPSSSFEVIAPQVADTYLNRPFPEARKDLSLDLLLHVSVKDSGGVPRIHAKLVRAADGVIMWVENRDLLAGALRDRSRAVAAELAGHVIRAAAGES